MFTQICVKIVISKNTRALFIMIFVGWFLFLEKFDFYNFKVSLIEQQKV